MTLNTTGANLLVFLNWYYTPSGLPVTPSDNKNTGNWFSVNGTTPSCFQFTATNICVMIAYSLSPVVGSGHVFSATWSAATNFTQMIVLAFASRAGTTPFMDYNSGAGVTQGGATSGTSVSVGTMTPAHANDLLVLAQGDSSTTSASMTPSGFTIIQPFSLTADMVAAWGIFGTVSVSPVLTLTPTIGSNGVSAQMYAFGAS